MTSGFHELQLVIFIFPVDLVCKATDVALYFREPLFASFLGKRLAISLPYCSEGSTCWYLETINDCTLQHYSVMICRLGLLGVNGLQIRQAGIACSRRLT